MRSFGIKKKGFQSNCIAGRFLVTNKLTQEMRGFLSPSIRLKKYDCSLFNLFFFLHSLSYFISFLIPCLFYYIAQFLVLAIWIKIPINISLKKKKRNLESASIIQGLWGTERGRLGGAVLKLQHFVLAIGDEEAICLCSVQSSYQGFVFGTT